MRTSRPLLAGLVALATALTGVALAEPAAAAGPKYPRVTAVAASADYLVYRQKTGSAYNLSFPKGSTLYAVGKDLERHRITGFDPEGFPSLQGSVLAQSTGSTVFDDSGATKLQPDHVRWRDLRTGAKGVTALPLEDDYVGAAPGGWITRRAVTDASGATTRHVIRWSTSGRATDLGAPFPGDGGRAVTVGSTGVVAATRHDDGGEDVSGTIRFRPYAKGSTWRTLLASGDDRDPFCASASATHVVCEVTNDKKHSGQVLLALNGRTRTWLDAHRSACQVIGLVAVGRAAVGKDAGDSGACRDHHLTRLAADGTVTRSTKSWGPHASGLTAGLGGLLLSTPDQRRIVRLDGVNGTARTIVTAR